MTTKQRVLILCTGNSCRSQMAEGLINHDLGEQWQADSAGTAPAGYVHPMAIAAMAELGIDLSDAQSKSTEEFRGTAFDAVITVCDDAFENCPLWLGDGVVTHIGFEDPAKAGGSDEEIMAVFRRVRDEIRTQVLGYLDKEALAAHRLRAGS
jgi:arsenate reductase